jgi:hypothetical protein
VSERREDDDVLGWIAVGVLTACGALSALLESMLIPLYAGRVLVPVAVVFAFASNIALPRLARAAIARTSAAIAPFAGWLLVILVLNAFTRPEGDVIYPGGKGLQWVTYGVILGGALAGTVSIVLSVPPPPKAPPAIRK